MSEAEQGDTILTEANLSDANLSEAVRWTEEQLTAAKFLEGATMPNGQWYEDWLKDKKVHGNDEKNE